MKSKGVDTSNAHLLHEHARTPDRGNGQRVIQPLVKPHSAPAGGPVTEGGRGRQVSWPLGKKQGR